MGIPDRPTISASNIRPTLMDLALSPYSESSGSSLLLDTVTGASAAYSLRKLRSAYAGSAIRVRRSSDNAEQDIGFSGDALDTSSLLTFCGAGDGFVTTWYDQSTNANNAVQATAASQPQIVAAGSLVTSETHPAMDCDSAAGDGLTAASIAPSSGLLVMIVAEQGATGKSFITQGQSRGGGSVSDFDIFDTGSALRGRISNSAGTHFDVDHSTRPVPGQLHLIGVASEATARRVRIDGNGTSVGASPETIASRSNLFLSGSGSFRFDGKQCEVVIWGSDQAANLATVEAEIDAYYELY